MDHSMHSTMTGMDMMATVTATATGAMASSTEMSSMDHGMGGGCQISMLWNWNTVDSCFISSSWHITSKGMFAGSCIGVILLVLALEFLRRAGKEYDHYILTQYARSLPSPQASISSASSNNDAGSKGPNTTAAPAYAETVSQTFRPTLLQQAIRALLHMLQFAVAYFVMLLAMYYNGYIIICIFIGAYIGYFIFGWETLQVKAGGQDRLQPNATVCCG